MRQVPALLHLHRLGEQTAHARDMEAASIEEFDLLIATVEQRLKSPSSPRKLHRRSPLTTGLTYWCVEATFSAIARVPNLAILLAMSYWAYHYEQIKVVSTRIKVLSHVCELLILS